MILWTLQPQIVWDKLQAEKVLIADPLLGEHCQDDYSYLPHYDWMRTQMSKRIQSYQGNYPWWAWKEWNNKQPRPDLRTERFRAGQGEPMVRLELNIPDEDVLLSDFDGWHGPLNGWMLCATEAEDKAWDEKWQAWRNPKGLTLAQIRVERVLEEAIIPTPKEFTDQIEASWEHCFDLDFMHNSELWGGDFWATQACFEFLRIEYVQKATPYLGAYKKSIS